MTTQPPADGATTAASASGQAPRSLFIGLLDDAAIFPPGDAPMAAALRAYTAKLRSHDAPFIGSFLCSAARLPELLTCLPADLLQLELSLVTSGDPAQLEQALILIAGSDRLQLRAVETRVGQGGVAPTLATLTALLPAGALGYVEVALDPGAPAAIEQIAGAGHRIKLRTGGTTPTEFPTSAALARGVLACLHADAAFKLTAGLHNAVRHRDPVTGFEHHGFLNVLAAIGTAHIDMAALASILEDPDASSLAYFARGLPDAAARSLRSRFVAFGTCSTDEPLADLRALGLLRQTS